jgi:hypothetical protein
VILENLETPAPSEADAQLARESSCIVRIQVQGARKNADSIVVPASPAAVPARRSRREEKSAGEIGDNQEMAANW